MRRAIAIGCGVLFLLAMGCGDSGLSAKRGLLGKSYKGKGGHYKDSMHGRKIASGEVYDKNDLTAAHAGLPFGTVVIVENRNNGLLCEVRINDYLAPASGLIIRVSKRAAEELEMTGAGVVPVRVTVSK